MVKSNKAALVRQLKKGGIPIPKNATIGQLEHRLRYWKAGSGYLFRLAVKSGRRHAEAKHLGWGKTRWVPNSDFARAIFNSRLVYFLGRYEEMPNGATLLDIPEGYGEEE